MLFFNDARKRQRKLFTLTYTHFTLGKLVPLSLFCLLWEFIYIFSFSRWCYSGNVALSPFSDALCPPPIHLNLNSYPICLLNILRATVLAKKELALQWIWMGKCWCAAQVMIPLCQIVLILFYIQIIVHVCASLTRSEVFLQVVAEKTCRKVVFVVIVADVIVVVSYKFIHAHTQ